jgi:hypothetical protein
VASDLSEESLYAIEWGMHSILILKKRMILMTRDTHTAIGTVLRNGDEVTTIKIR